MILKNVDILKRLRYAMDINDIEMVKIFKLGGIDITKEDVRSLINGDTENQEVDEENDEKDTISNLMIDSFLNGFIIYKRGVQETRTDQEKPVSNNENVNNVLLKKLKIALQLTSEDMLSIFELAGITVTKGELSAVLRKVGHRNYKVCGDRYIRNFLKGLTIKYRK